MLNIIKDSKLELIQKQVNALNRNFLQNSTCKHMVSLKHAYRRLLKHNQPNKHTIQSVVKLLISLAPDLLCDGNPVYDKDDVYEDDFKGFFTRKGIREAIDNRDIYDEDSMNYDPCDMDQLQFKRVKVSEINIAHDKDCKYFAILDEDEAGDDNLIAELPTRDFVMKYVKRVFKDYFPNEKINTQTIYSSDFMKAVLQIVLDSRTFAGSNASDLKIILKQLFTRNGFANKKSRLHLSLYHMIKFMERHNKHFDDYQINDVSIVKAQNLFDSYCAKLPKIYAKNKSNKRDDILQDNIDNLHNLVSINRGRYLMFSHNLNAFDYLYRYPDLIIVILFKALGIKL